MCVCVYTSNFFTTTGKNSPKITPTQCLTLSKIMTKGEKVLVLKICDFVVVVAIVGDKCEEEMQGVSH